MIQPKERQLTTGLLAGKWLPTLGLQPGEWLPAVTERVTTNSPASSSHQASYGYEKINIRYGTKTLYEIQVRVKHDGLDFRNVDFRDTVWNSVIQWHFSPPSSPRQLAITPYTNLYTRDSVYNLPKPDNLQACTS